MSLFSYIIRTLLVVIPGTLLLGMGVCFFNGISGPAFIYTNLVNILFGALIGVISASMNHKRFIAPITSIVKYIEALKNGDLKAVPDRSKSGQLHGIVNSLEEMSQIWRETLTHVNDSASHIASLSEELSSSAEQTTEGTNQVAATIQEVVTESDQQNQNIQDGLESINNMSSGIKLVASSARLATTQANEALTTANEGNQTVQKAVHQMAQLDDTFKELEHRIQRLNSKSKQVGTIIKAITEISEQTHLLALNAAIEAARAGEQGRGFAVVADEVRKLAEQSSQSAKEITELVQTIQEDTLRAVTSTSTAASEMTEGRDAVLVAGEAFEQIQKALSLVNNQIEAVSETSTEITAFTQQVVDLITHIAHITEHAAASNQTVSASAEEQLASMEEITSASVTLSNMSEELQLLVSKFNL
jgi:methyl-accepting chemotaxis protein